MSNSDTELRRARKLNEKLILVLENLITKCNWEANAFLGKAKKKFIDLLNDAKHLSETMNNDSVTNEKTVITSQQQLPQDMVWVYVLLYQVQNENLRIWQQLLKSLPQYGGTRPIYANEKDVREFIRSKPDVVKYGYGKISVKKIDILENNIKKDALGNKLLALKDASIKLENIASFVHANAKKYKFKDSILILEKHQEDN